MKTPCSIDRHDLAIVAVAALLALLGLADRPVEHFDEVINASRAFRGAPVFNYASRPVFYSLSWLAVQWLGRDLVSLRLAAAVLYVATAWLLFRLGRRLGGPTAGWLAALGYGGSQIVLFEGIRGMPHLPAGFFATLSLVCAAAAWQGARSAGLLAGFFAAAALGSHPTLVAFVAALALVAGADLLAALRRLGARRAGELLARPAAWLLAGLAAGGVLLLAGHLVTDATYPDQLQAMVDRVQGAERYAANARSVLYYPWVLLQDPVLLVLAAAAVLLPAGLLVLRRREAAAGFLRDGMLLRIVFVALASLAIVTLARWKFERVLVAFVPLLAVAAAAVVARARELIAGPVARRRVTAVVVSFAVAAAAAGAWRGRQRLEAAESAGAEENLRSAELVRTLTDESAVVGYLGPPWASRRAAQITRLGQRTPRNLNRVLRTLPREEGLDEVMIERDIRLLWRVQPQWREDLAGIDRWRDRLHLFRPVLIHRHMDQLDLWMLVPQTTFDRQLQELASGDAVAVWDGAGAEAPLAVWAGEALAAHGLELRRLPPERLRRAQLAALDRNGVEHVLLLAAAAPDVERRERASRRVLRSHGAERLGRDAAGGAELWRLPGGPASSP